MTAKYHGFSVQKHIISLVEHGHGISLIPDGHTLTETSKHVITLPLPEPAPYRDIGLLYRNHSPLIQVIHAIADLLIAKPLYSGRLPENDVVSDDESAK